MTLELSALPRTNPVRPSRLLLALLPFVPAGICAAFVLGWSGVALVVAVAGIGVSTWLGLYTAAGIGG